MAVQNSATQQSFDYVTGFLRARQYVLVDRESTCTNVVGNAAKPSAVVRVVFVVDRTNFCSGLNDWEQAIDVIIRGYVLQYASSSFESHAGVDILARQWSKVIRWIAQAVELREDQIPDLDVFAIVELIVDFTARAADAIRTLAGSASWPEVLVLVHVTNARSRQSDLLIPDLGSLLVVFVDGDGQSLAVDAEPLLRGQKFPGPSNGFFFEVVAEAEVAQHLKKRVVEGRPSYVFDIARP